MAERDHASRSSEDEEEMEVNPVIGEESLEKLLHLVRIGEVLLLGCRAASRRCRLCQGLGRERRRSDLVKKWRERKRNLKKH